MNAGFPGIKWRFWHMLLLCFCIAASATAGKKNVSSVQLKSAYVLNIIKFTSWPEDHPASVSGRFILCLYGEGALASALTKLRGKSVKSAQLEIKQLFNEQALPFCHALYIDKSEKRHSAYILSLLSDRNVLTFGAFKGFIDDGGMVNLVERGGKIRFEVNQAALEHTELKVSSKVLKLAIIRK